MYRTQKSNQECSCRAKFSILASEHNFDTMPPRSMNPMSEYSVFDQADLKGKKVLLRAGFDVPVEDGVVQDTTRIDAVVPSMKYVLDHGGALILMAHQGRPKDGPDPKFTQKSLVPVLEKILGVPVRFADGCVSPAPKEAAKALKPGEVLLLENLRFE